MAKLEPIKHFLEMSGLLAEAEEDIQEDTTVELEQTAVVAQEATDHQEELELLQLTEEHLTQHQEALFITEAFQVPQALETTIITGLEEAEAQLKLAVAEAINQEGMEEMDSCLT
jgi:hypothetical protein